MNDKYEPVIGLEIHVQLKTKSKMFCGSPNSPDTAPPNANICEVCSGQPGSLPAANREAVRKAALVGLALGCGINEHSRFDRKHYFYPDLPKGYQISQYEEPISSNGQFKFLVDGGEKTVRIRRAHLEEDTGRLIHEDGSSLVDLNRAGVPLLEIVTEPDFRSALEVRVFLRHLRNIVRYLGASDGDMEKGHLRGEPNVSVRHADSGELPNYKVELKNINSFKNVFDAVTYEIRRQTEALERRETLASETRGWDGGKTIVQRVKEEAKDYRYFPEPDLPLLRFSKNYVDDLRRSLPELPQDKEKRFIAQFGLPSRDAEVLASDKDMAGYFEEVVSELAQWHEEENLPDKSIQKFAKLAANWITGDLRAITKVFAEKSKISAENMAELIKMIEHGQISSTAGKKVLAVMFERGGDPSNIALDEGLAQVSDEAEIEKIVDEVVAANEKAAADYRAGKKQALGVLVGQVMARTKGKANPQVVNKILREKLG